MTISRKPRLPERLRISASARRLGLCELTSTYAITGNHAIAQDLQTIETAYASVPINVLNGPLAELGSVLMKEISVGSDL